MLELSHIYKSFGDQDILRDISFRVNDGEKLCIIGASGSGKSVTMKILIGILKADQGEVVIDGKNLTRARQSEWNEVLGDVGVVFQGAALFDSLTVLENVGIRLYENRSLPNEEIHARCRQAVAAVGLDPDTVLRKFPSELSGGMQKRVGIARAIVHRPKYLFYDEPTTGLDPVNSGLIDDLMAQLAQDEERTSVIITHDMYTVKAIATKVAFIHQKQLHFFGTPAEMFASDDPQIRAFLSRSLSMSQK